MKLQPGESYSVQVTVTNKSLYLAEPIGASLTIEIEAALNGVALIPHEQFEDWFEAEEDKTYAWTLIVPSDVPTSSGAIMVTVRDPNGTKLAEASVDIHVESVDPGELRVAEIFLADINNPNLPGRGIFAVLQGIVPDGREFYMETRARRIAPTTGTHGSNRTRPWFSGVHQYTATALRSGETYEWINIDVYDYQGGPLLTNGRIDFDPPYYQE